MCVKFVSKFTNKTYQFWEGEIFLKIQVYVGSLFFLEGGDVMMALLLFPEILVFLATTPGVKLGVASFGRHWQTRYKVGPLVTSYNWVEITPMVLG